MRIVLTNRQLDKLADISIGLGQLFFGSLVIPLLIPTLDKPSLPVLAFGLLTAIGLWIFAMWLMKGKK